MGVDVVVAVCMNKCTEMIVTLLGILKAGGAYLPLDPDHPLERLSYMLEDGGVGIVITQNMLEERLPAYWGQTVCLDLEWETIGALSEIPPDDNAHSENMAYVIYTSGSTGKPKGVSISRRGLANSTCARLNFYREPVNSFLLVSPFGFDSSVAGIYWTLCQGGTLVLPPDGLERDPAQLIMLMGEKKISHLLCLPTLYSWVLTESRPGQLNSLKCVIVAGEACPSEVVERHGAAISGAELFNEYGPTEGTVWSSVYGDCVNDRRTPTPIGKPISNIQMYIVDEEQEPAPIGVRGEIYIAGMGLARGYLGKPELTAERFLPNNVGGEEGGRVYRTGDLGRYLSDGNIEFIGRADEQVKVRGYRIELGEIQAALQEHRSVRQSVVVASNDDRGDKRVIGYVVVDGAVTDIELKKDLRQRLPGYMVPEAIILLEEMPLTANGKVDRKKLPAVSDTRPKRESLLAPRDVLEFQLTQIWETILGVRPIDVRDDFFDLGGHSLLAVSLMAKIRSVMGRDLPLSVLFQGGTVERLAAILRREANSMSFSCLVGFQTSGSRPPMFFAHPAGGNVLCYLNLARCLGPDQPFYGLQTPGLYGERDLYESIEDMASYYIDALRTIQPEGPYFLGGCSLGGVIAYEMAQQLIAQGQKISQLLLLDSNAATLAEEYIDGDDASLLMELLPEELAISEETLKQFEGAERIDYILKNAINRNLLPPEIGAVQARSFLKVYRTNVKARRKYIPQAYADAITLFKTTKRAAMSSNGAGGDFQAEMAPQDPTKGWDKLAAGGVRVIDVPGRHATMLDRPHVETLAKRIIACLNSKVEN